MDAVPHGSMDARLIGRSVLIGVICLDRSSCTDLSEQGSVPLWVGQILGQRHRHPTAQDPERDVAAVAEDLADDVRGHLRLEDDGDTEGPRRAGVGRARLAAEVGLAALLNRVRGRCARW